MKLSTPIRMLIHILEETKTPAKAGVFVER